MVVFNNLQSFRVVFFLFRVRQCNLGCHKTVKMPCFRAALVRTCFVKAFVLVWIEKAAVIHGELLNVRD